MVNDELLSLPVISIGYVPDGVPPVVVTVSVQIPGALIEAGLKVALAPAGTPPVICMPTVGEPLPAPTVIV